MRACVLGCVLVPALGVSGAAAQLNVHLVFDRTEVMVGETVEATLVATISAPEGSYFSSISANLIASDASLGLASTMSGLDWGMSALGAVQSGTPDGANLMGIFAAQQSLFGAVDTSSPFVIGQFTITALAEGQLTYISTPANAAPGSFSSTYNSPFPPPPYTNSMSSDTLTIRAVPAPGVLAVLGLGGMVARRRRRGVGC